MNDRYQIEDLTGNGDVLLVYTIVLYPEKID